MQNKIQTRILNCLSGNRRKNLNGYTNQELADMFSSFSIPSNVIFEKEFSTLLNNQDQSGEQLCIPFK